MTFLAHHAQSHAPCHDGEFLKIKQGRMHVPDAVDSYSAPHTRYSGRCYFAVVFPGDFTIPCAAPHFQPRGAQPSGSHVHDAFNSTYVSRTKSVNHDPSQAMYELDSPMNM
ncbi:hypothetical protein MN608_04754 [Microdochium nivale]|nr:hypothetical protein MN608_04754 [Microdochium nivale]